MGVYIAVQSAVLRRDGERVVIKEGISRASEEFASQYPNLFAPADGVHFDVQEATAVPGEKRGEPEHTCDECGFEAKTKGGLTSHQRSHN